MSSKIKLEREDKLDLVVNGFVFKKGALYHFVKGELANHAYYLKKILYEDNDWVLLLGEHKYDTHLAVQEAQESHPMNFRKCECSFACEGFVLKNFQWLTH